jgi:hypothetical protein
LGVTLDSTEFAEVKSTGLEDGSCLFFVREIQGSKLAVVFYSCAVVGLCRFDFIAEITEYYSGSVECYPYTPFLFVFHPVKPFVFRTALTSIFLSVAYVLGLSCGAEIGLSVIKAVAVNMIDVHIIRDLEYNAVHVGAVPFAFFGYNTSDGVEGSAALDGVPFVF